MSTKFKDYQTKPDQIKEEQRTLRLAGCGVEPVDVENLELVGSKPWRSRADGRRGGARAILVATDRRSAAPAAAMMDLPQRDRILFVFLRLARGVRVIWLFLIYSAAIYDGTQWAAEAEKDKGFPSSR